MDCGGPPTPNTGEPQGLRGSHCCWECAPNSTTSGRPSAAAACAGPVSTEIMLCERAHSASRRGNRSSAAATAGSCAAAAIHSSSRDSRGAPHSTMSACGSRAWMRRSSPAQRSSGHALSSAGKTRSRRPRMVRRLPGCTSIRVRSRQPCRSSHAAHSARAASDTVRSGAQRGAGAGHG